jgi:predicted nucleic acid-binding Zn ribbon protein
MPASSKRRRERRRTPIEAGVMARYAGDEPVPLSDALAKVGAELGLPPGDTHGTLDARWAEVMGTDVAVHARLVSVRDGTLTVAVDDPIWATQLRYLEPAVVTRATALLGPGVVTRVKVRVGRP